MLPTEVNWGTLSADLGGSTISNAVWQGTTIATGYGGTGLTSFTSGGALYATSTSSLTSGTLPVTAGGTGDTTFTANGVLYGNGTSALSATGTGTTGQVLLANTGGAPTWGSVPSTGAVTSFQTSLNGLTPSTSTTGAVTLAGTLGISSGGTGQTTASAAFNALSPITTAGDLILGNGANSATRLGIGTNGYVLTSNGTTASWAAASSGVTITNDTSTATALYPSFTSATSGSVSGLSVTSTKLKFVPSTGTFTTPNVEASNGMLVNSNTVSTNYSIPVGSSAIAAGPITVASGASVTIPSGSRWVVL
jgi:hypothetical protein